MPKVLDSFFKLRLGEKIAFLALGGGPQPLKKPFRIQMDLFSDKMNAMTDA